MITPGYSTTATERVLPRLALDFTTASLDSRVTVTRALNTATRVNSSGYIETVNANLPRFDFDPVTLQCKGLLIEETRANLALYSQRFEISRSIVVTGLSGTFLNGETVTATGGGTGKYISSGSSSILVLVSASTGTFTGTLTGGTSGATATISSSTDIYTVTNASVTTGIMSPDGTASANKIIADATANTSHSIYGVVRNITPGTRYTTSIYLKAAEYTTATIVLGNAGGGQASYAVTLTGSGSGVLTDASPQGFCTASITPAGNNWYRVVVSCTAYTGANQGYFVYYIHPNTSVNYTGNNVNGIYAYGFVTEEGAFATSYIPTTTTSLTRNADDVLMTGTNFSSWFNATQGTFSSQFIINAKNSVTQVNGLFCSSALSGTNRITVFGGTSTYSSRVVESGNITSLDVGTVSTNQVQNVALAYKQNSFALSANAVTPGTSISGNIPAYVDRLAIGNLSYIGTTQGYQLNGCMQKIRYWPQRLINAEVQAFSK